MRLLILVAMSLLSATTLAHNQLVVHTTDARHNVSIGQAGPSAGSLVSIYTVPVGNKFVLTDLIAWESGTTDVKLEIWENSTEKLRVLINDSNVYYKFTSGIVFDSETQVKVVPEFGNISHISISGYLY